MIEFRLHPIGFIRKKHKENYLEILPEFQVGLYRLETISHAFILWWIHENDTLEARKAGKTIPRVTNAFSPPQEMGTFATRSPRRPNPIGMTLVKIIKVVDQQVFVDHIDAFDGTPILDIKPYLPNGDRIEDGLFLPPWFQHLLSSRPSNKKDICEES